MPAMERDHEDILKIPEVPEVEYTPWEKFVALSSLIVVPIFIIVTIEVKRLIDQLEEHVTWIWPDEGSIGATGFSCAENGNINAEMSILTFYYVMFILMAVFEGGKLIMNMENICCIWAGSKQGGCLRISSFILFHCMISIQDALTPTMCEWIIEAEQTYLTIVYMYAATIMSFVNLASSTVLTPSLLLVKESIANKASVLGIDTTGAPSLVISWFDIIAPPGVAITITITTQALPSFWHKSFTFTLALMAAAFTVAYLYSVIESFSAVQNFVMMDQLSFCMTPLMTLNIVYAVAFFIAGYVIFVSLTVGLNFYSRVAFALQHALGLGNHNRYSDHNHEGFCAAFVEGLSKKPDDGYFDILDFIMRAPQNNYKGSFGYMYQGWKWSVRLAHIVSFASILCGIGLVGTVCAWMALAHIQGQGSLVELPTAWMIINMALLMVVAVVGFIILIWLLMIIPKSTRLVHPEPE